MADNLNEAAVEDTENDEEIVDYETECIIKILFQLDRAPFDELPAQELDRDGACARARQVCVGTGSTETHP